MKILLVHNFYLQPGGEDQVFLREGNLLEEKGHQVFRYTHHNKDTDNYGRVALLHKTLWNGSVYRELRSLIKKERPDVIHLHNTFPLISPSAYYAARKERVPVVQTLHNYRLLCPSAVLFRDGVPCEDCIGKKVPWPGVLHHCYKDSMALSGAVTTMLAFHRAIRTWERGITTYIVMTEFARNKFIEGGIPAQQIRLKRHFLDTDPGLGDGKGNFAIFVGRLSHEKGINTLLEAWKILRGNTKLKIIGDGPLAPIVAQAASDNPNIRWLGRKPTSEIYDLLGEATCLIFPSELYETFGIVIIEAYAKGTPVIAARVGAASEIVIDDQTGLHFKPGSAADLVEKIRWLLGHPVKAAEMRKRARREFVAQYSASVNYETLMNIYSNAIMQQEADSHG